MNTTEDWALADLLQRLRGRFYGKYRGIVTAVEPATCRIKAKVPAVFGTAESGWCLPCVPYAGPNVGIAFLPEVQSGVWIEFEGGNVSFPVWVGGYWHDGEVPAAVDAGVKVIATKASTQFTFDDDEGSLTITDGNGNSVTLDGSAITLSRGATTVALNGSTVSINGSALEVSA